MQKHVNLVDLVKSFPTNIFLQNLASIQKRTSPIKFAHLNLLKNQRMVRYRTFQLSVGPGGHGEAVVQPVDGEEGRKRDRVDLRRRDLGPREAGVRCGEDRGER